MTNSLTFQAGSGQVIVTGLPSEEVQQLRHVWRRCDAQSIAVTEDKDGSLGTTDGARHVSRDEASALDQTAFQERVVYAATQASIDAGRGDQLMFHATALAHPETGAAIALIAASGTGKTTAARVLGKHLSYLTDETTIIDPISRRITPYPKPLSILDESGMRPKIQHSPDSLELLPTMENAFLSGLVVLDRCRDEDTHQPPRVETLSLEEALEHIIPQTSSLAALDRGLVKLCEAIDQVGGVKRLRYYQAEDLVDTVMAIVSSSDDSPPESPIPHQVPTHRTGSVEREWQPLPVDDLCPSQSGIAETNGMLRRNPVHDAIIIGQQALLVLHDERSHTLSGLGYALWDLTRQWISADQLHAILGSAEGAPPDAHTRVNAGIEMLVTEDIIQRS